MASKGYRIGTLKHTAHSFQLDREGKDSYKLKNSGSKVGGIFNDDCIGIIKDFDVKEDQEKLIAVALNDMDLVLIEGYKLGKYPKILILGDNDFQQEIKGLRKDELIAIVGEGSMDTDLNCYGKDEIKKVAEFLELEFIKPYSVQDIDLYINNKPVVLNEFVQKVMKNIINGIIASLKGIDKKISLIDLWYYKSSKK